MKAAGRFVVQALLPVSVALRDGVAFDTQRVNEVVDSFRNHSQGTAQTLGNFHEYLLDSTDQVERVSNRSDYMATNNQLLRRVTKYIADKMLGGYALRGTTKIDTVGLALLVVCVILMCMTTFLLCGGRSWPRPENTQFGSSTRRSERRATRPRTSSKCSPSSSRPESDSDETPDSPEHLKSILVAHGIEFPKVANQTHTRDPQKIR